jgi:hypothetical protein
MAEEQVLADPEAMLKRYPPSEAVWDVIGYVTLSK